MYLLLIVGFSVVGIQLFCYIKPQGNLLIYILYFYIKLNHFFTNLEYLGGYDDNFFDLWSAMITMFKISTPSDWFRIMHDSSRKQAPSFTCFEIIDYEDFAKYGLNG